MVKGTTNRCVTVEVSIPQELYYDVGQELDYRGLECQYGSDKCGSNKPDAEWLLRSCILQHLADVVGLPDGELVINEDGTVEANRKRSDDGTFAAVDK